MNTWLMKTEPGTYSWSNLRTDQQTSWDGVRNYQASNNMKRMAIGDKAFFYHSIREKSIVGIVSIVQTYHPDPTDDTGRFGMVTVAMDAPLYRPVTLSEMKTNGILQTMPLITQSRLSVMPVTPSQWREVLILSGNIAG
ncbi:MAG: EVE domain-containing protein [Alphaproteobacteria bacterium]|nr:MAG: EVE domain-containing protein [Alphaproteobacteria bacterium]